MKKFRRVVGVCLAVIIPLTILGLLQQLLIPKYMGRVVEGAMIEEYYDETTDHDVIVLGDCESYESISPIRLWEDYGITSYIRGGANQLVWQSYYLLEDTLRYEKPKVVVFNVFALTQAEQTNEAYNRMNIDGMRWSKSKVDDIEASMTEGENILQYVFPILRFHSRWKELTGEDVKYMFHKDIISHNGYYLRTDVLPVGELPRERPLADYTFSTKCMTYLDKMRELCEAHDIKLVLMKAPSVYPSWADEWEMQVEEYAAEHDLLYINCLEENDAIGIDYTTDTYDAGMHMNLYGAEKVSDYLGDKLKSEYGLEDHRDDEKYSDVYACKTIYYSGMIEEQQNDIKTYGYIKQFRGE